MDTVAVMDRLRIVLGPQSYRAIAKLTEMNPESVRRYMHGREPSVEFISRVCLKLGVRADWILFGIEPVLEKDAERTAISSASITEILYAIVGVVERTVDRIDRIEAYIQTNEQRIESCLSPIDRNRDTAKARLACDPKQ